MKTIQVLSILAALCICQLSNSQKPSSIQVLDAWYGNGSQQTNVMAKLQSLVYNPKPGMRVGTELFGPASTTSNALSVAFSYNA